MKTLGLTMLVLNETDTLRVLFESVKMVQFDEICVAWSGTNPETEAILKENNCKIFPIVWPGNFGDPRRTLYKESTTEYVMWLDADDKLVGGEHIREILESVIERGVNSIRFPYKYRFDEFGVCTNCYARERIVKRDQFEWKNKTSEWLGVIDGEQEIDCYITDVDVHVHHQTHQITWEGLNRNLEMSKKEYEANPTAPHAMWYGQSLFDLARWKESLEIFDEFMKINENEQHKYYILILKFVAYKELKEFQLANHMLNQAIKIYPTCGRPYFGKAELAFINFNWQEVIDQCEIGFSLDGFANPSFPDNPLSYTLYPSRWYGTALLNLRQYVKANNIAVNALNTYPQDKFMNEIRRIALEEHFKENKEEMLNAK